MKRTLELVSFVSFVSFVMAIVLADVTPAKKPIDRSIAKPSAKIVFPTTKIAIYKGGFSTYQ
jgi:hypothetical protein